MTRDEANRTIGSRSASLPSEKARDLQIHLFALRLGVT